MVKLYYYSGTMLTFVRAKGALAKPVGAGVFIGILLLVGAVKLNQSVANAGGIGSTSTLKAENGILRQQIGLITPRVDRLELQSDLLRERTNGFRKLLQRRSILRDTVGSFTNLTAGSGLVTRMVAAKSPLP